MICPYCGKLIKFNDIDFSNEENKNYYNKHIFSNTENNSRNLKKLCCSNNIDTKQIKNFHSEELIRYYNEYC